MKKCEYCFEQHKETTWNIGFINGEWLCLECGDKVEIKEEENADKYESIKADNEDYFVQEGEE